MKQQKSRRRKKTYLFIFLVCILLPNASQAAPRQITGDWHIKVEQDNRQMPAVLWLSLDKNEKLTGKWISVWGASDLIDLSYTDNTLRFNRTSRFRGQEIKTSFVGQLQKGKLSGTMTRETEASKATGERIRPVKRPVGNWDMKVKVGEQEYPATLQILSGEQGELLARWQSQWGEHEITDVQFKNPNLSFTRNSTVEDRLLSSTFAGQIKNHTLAGTFQSERGPITARGERVGGALVGRWDLRISSESGERTQILRIYPDLSGLYGPIPIAKVNVAGEEVTFKAEGVFNERNFTYSFKGRLDARKLQGDLTSTRGSQSVAGQKIVVPSTKRASGAEKKSFRRPDVVFVPTPQEVVDRMLILAKVKKDDVVYDLGCGDGRIVVTAAREYGCRGVGYDISAKRVKESRENVATNGVENLVSIERADIFTLDLSPASVITLYLLPELNVKLIPQLDKLGPGVRIVSHDFEMEGVMPDQVIGIEDPNDDYGNHTLYLWTTPLNKTSESNFGR